MAIDWEGILGAEGNAMQSAYDDAIERAEQIESGRWDPESDSTVVINWLPGDGWPEPPPDDDGDHVFIECDGNYPFCEGDCENCLYCRCCDGAYEACDGNCDACPYDRGIGRADEAEDSADGELLTVDPFPIYAPDSDGSSDSDCCDDPFDDEFDC